MTLLWTGDGGIICLQLGLGSISAHKDFGCGYADGHLKVFAGRDDQPEEDPAHLPGGTAGGQAATQTQACCRHQGASSGPGYAEQTLKPGLGARPDGVRTAVPSAQRGG